MKKVSVIVPVYNLERYITPCIKSLQSQTFSDFEVIIINDGSVDDSLRVITQLITGDNRFKVIDKVNGGVVHARCVGIEASSGEYLLFLDGDDYIDNNALEVLYNRALECDADVVALDIKTIGRRRLVPAGERLNIGVMDNKSYIRYIIKESLYQSITAHFCRRELFDGVIHKTELFYGEDIYLCYQLLVKAKKVTSVWEKPLYFYVIRKGSATNTKFSDRKAENNIILSVKVCELLDGIGMERELQNYFKLLYYSSILYSGCTKNIMGIYEQAEDIFQSGELPKGFLVKSYRKFIFCKLWRRYPRLFLIRKGMSRFFRDKVMRNIGRLLGV